MQKALMVSSALNSYRSQVKQKEEGKVKRFLHQMAPNFYIAFSVHNQRAAPDLAIPMPSHTGFFIQLIATLDLTSSTDVFRWGGRDQKYS